jgi:hypothetical protein
MAQAMLTVIAPPDKQPAAIKLVIEQMDALAPVYAQAAREGTDVSAVSAHR